MSPVKVLCLVHVAKRYQDRQGCCIFCLFPGRKSTPTTLPFIVAPTPVHACLLAFAPGCGFRAERVRVLRGEHFGGDGCAFSRHRAARLTISVGLSGSFHLSLSASFERIILFMLWEIHA